MNSDNKLLLRALTLNAIFSGASALITLIAGGWFVVQFSLGTAVPVYVIAGILAVFAFQLTNIVRTRNIRTWEIIGIIAGDIAWVVASVVIAALYYRMITPTALILVVLVALAVFYFSIMQIRGLRQYRKQPVTTSLKQTFERKVWGKADIQPEWQVRVRSPH
jgi:hypothetical protein